MSTDTLPVRTTPEQDARFKIDISDDGSQWFPFILFVRHRGWFHDHWVQLHTFKTQQEAREQYELLKNLPEYLP